MHFYTSRAHLGRFGNFIDSGDVSLVESWARDLVCVCHRRALSPSPVPRPPRSSAHISSAHIPLLPRTRSSARIPLPLVPTPICLSFTSRPLSCPPFLPAVTAFRTPAPQPRGAPPAVRAARAGRGRRRWQRAASSPSSRAPTITQVAVHPLRLEQSTALFGLRNGYKYICIYILEQSTALPTMNWAAWQPGPNPA